MNNNAEIQEASQKVSQALWDMIVLVHYNSLPTFRWIRFRWDRKCLQDWMQTTRDDEWTLKVLKSDDGASEVRDILVKQVRRNFLLWWACAGSTVLSGIFVNRYVPELPGYVYSGYWFSAASFFLSPLIHNWVELRSLWHWNGAWARLNALALPSQITKPPSNAEFLMWWLLPLAKTDEVLGHLSELYVEAVERFGERRAKVWYWSEVARALWPLLERSAGRLLRFIIAALMRKD